MNSQPETLDYPQRILYYNFHVYTHANSKRMWSVFLTYEWVREKAPEIHKLVSKTKEKFVLKKFI